MDEGYLIIYLTAQHYTIERTLIRKGKKDKTKYLLNYLLFQEGGREKKE